MSETDRSESERIAFCQNCGKPLSGGGVRHVGSAVYCDPCLVAKVAAADASGAGSPGPKYGFSSTSSGVNYNFQGSIPPPGVPGAPGAPNPGLAALLGFIPGVGAFYNGQYAKGIVHLVVFALLTSFADHNGIFGLFVAGWIFYQVIEAHHTARARRDGTPLPNPFGLNDIGERLGFGKAWPAAAATHVPVPPAQGAAAQSGVDAGGAPQPESTSSAYQYVPPTQAYAPYPPPQAAWGAPTDAYGSVVPPVMPEMPMGVPNARRSNVPMGAFLLIGLGVLFLIGNSGFFHHFPVERLIPFVLIGVGVWLFVRKMMDSGGSLADDGSPAYRLRLFRAARGPVWIVLVGVLFLLDTFDILSWGRSWPLFIILGGLMTIFERTASTAVTPMPYGYPSVPSPVGTPAAESTSATTSTVVPGSSQERERE